MLQNFGLPAYHESYAGAPTDGSAWKSGGDGKYRLLRGGSWNYDSTLLRSAYRGWLAPDARVNAFGFRVASSPRT